MSISAIDGISGYDYDCFSTHIQLTVTEQFNSGALQQDVRVRKVNPHTLIHKAILENNAEVVRFLLAQGVSVDYPDESGMSPLTIAILNQCTYVIETLLQHGASVSPSVKWNDMSLIEIALNMKDMEAVKLLLAHGADINSKIGEESILSYFIRQGTKQATDLSVELIDRGANIHSSTLKDCPLMAAIGRAQWGDYVMLNKLISAGVNLNIVQKHNGIDWATPLLDVVERGNLKVVKFLVEAGVDVNQSIKKYGKEMQTPLKCALINHRVDIIQYLLQHGAKA